MKVAVIGGGAAGFFAALSVKAHHPEASVLLFEGSQKLLAKVRVSGGGRCNVTNSISSPSDLSKAYPRGGKALKKLFQEFGTQHTIRWFEDRGVALKTEADGRVFPRTDRSETIIQCLLQEAENGKIKICNGTTVTAIKQVSQALELHFAHDARPAEKFDKVIVATGGSPKRSGLAWLEEMGHQIQDPVPSLFTFNMPGNKITQLMGVVAENTLVRIEGTKLLSTGPLLITHWGMSGPAILKLSAFGARELHGSAHAFNVLVNWVGEKDHGKVSNELERIAETYPNKQLGNTRPYDLPERLWLFLLDKAGVHAGKPWNEIGRRAMNKLTATLTNDIYAVRGKTTFKEEFVTCGGVSLESVNMRTMESKACTGLYFAGEVLDIDAITGGFNFQAAWTTGYIAGQLG